MPKKIKEENSPVSFLLELKNYNFDKKEVSEFQKMFFQAWEVGKSN